MGIFTKRNGHSHRDRESVGSCEFLFPGDGGAPDRDGDDVFDGVAIFAAVIVAAGKRVAFGHAVGEIEVAADLLGRMNGAAGFV